MSMCKSKESSIPVWLLENEDYNPVPDKDTFINRSILSILGLISKIRAQGEAKTEKLKVNAALRVAFTLLLAVLVSISQSFMFVVVTGVCLLVILSFMQGEDIVKVLRVSLVMGAFTLVVLLPAALYGNYFSSVMITVKVTITVTAVGILSNLTRWHSITNALKRFFVPDIFILVLDITIKYIAGLGEFVLGMLYALKLRSVGRNRSKHTSLSGIAGVMFIKSKEMGEDMYSAMECRGFTGEYRVNGRFGLNLQDLAYLVVNAGIVLIFIYFERV